MDYEYSRKEELIFYLKDEYCDLERIATFYQYDCGSALPFIEEAKQSIAQALQCLDAVDLDTEIPDCQTWVNPLQADSSENN